MKVKEIIEFLKEYNPEAEITVGDNFDNGISISYAGGDACTKADCSFVCFEKRNNIENVENRYI